MLSDRECVNDIYLLAYHHSDMQAMVVELASTSAVLGLTCVGGCVGACDDAWDIQRPSHLLTFMVLC